MALSAASASLNSRSSVWQMSISLWLVGVIVGPITPSSLIHSTVCHLVSHACRRIVSSHRSTPAASVMTVLSVGAVLPIFTARCFASAILAMCLCLSVTSQCSIETAERIELVFGVWASFHPSYTVLKENSVTSENKGTFLWNFVVNSGLRKFRHGISIVETCYRLSSRKVDAQSVINWAVVGQLSR